MLFQCAIIVKLSIHNFNARPHHLFLPLFFNQAK
jgi:hypothetical protein